MAHRPAAQVAVLLGITAVLVACSGTSPLPTAPSAAPSSVEPDAAVACQDTEAPILIGPDGQQIVLSPAAAPSPWVSDTGLTYYLRQVGECVWMATYVSTEETGGENPFLSVFMGRLAADLLIVGEFADLTGVLVPTWDNGPLTYRVTVEDGAVVLVEERSPDTAPPGCASGDAPCPIPRRLERLSD